MSDQARRVYRPPNDAAEQIRRLVGLHGKDLPPLCWCTGFDPIGAHTVNDLIRLVDSWREPEPIAEQPCRNCGIRETTGPPDKPRCLGCGRQR